MSNHLHDRLAELADDAPLAASDPADLWARGVRRQRRRRAAYAGAGVAAALALVAGVALGGQLVGESAEPRPAVPPVSELHLPDRIVKPDPWSEDTDDAGEIGPLAAIGEAERMIPRGWNGEAMSYEHFGVSAVDGTTRFLKFDVDEEAGEQQPPGGLHTIALSPDGRYLGFKLYEAGAEGRHVITGWRLQDTVTGEVTKLEDPDVPRFPGDYATLIFSGDSNYLLTTYPLHGRPRSSRNIGLVAWHVETGERIVLEEPGHYWQPGIGSAPRGVLVDRKFTVRWIDPAAGEIERFRLPKAVVSSSIGPDGKAFAYVGGDWTPGRNGGINARTWRLFVGPDRDHLRQVDLPEDDLASSVLGWSDATHVIVNGWGPDYAEVDVTTGEVRAFRIPGSGGGPTTLAQGLWANDLVPAVDAEPAGDPRMPWQIGTYAVGAAVLVLGVLGWRRRARR